MIYFQSCFFDIISWGFFWINSGKCFYLLVSEAATRCVFLRKAVLRNFAKFTGKHLCHSLYLNHVQAYTFFTEHLLTTASEV